jgi:hypothetical protein
MSSFSTTSLVSASVIAISFPRDFFGLLRLGKMDSAQYKNNQQQNVLVPMPCHLMTLSARASKFGGIVRPTSFTLF